MICGFKLPPLKAAMVARSSASQATSEAHEIPCNTAPQEILIAYPQLTADQPPETAVRFAGESDSMIEDVFDTIQLPPGVGRGSMDRKNWY